MPVVNSLHVAADDGDAECVVRTSGFDDRGGLGLSKRAQTKGNSDCQQKLGFQGISLRQGVCRIALYRISVLVRADCLTERTGVRSGLRMRAANQIVAARLQTQEPQL